MFRCLLSWSALAVLFAVPSISQAQCPNCGRNHGTTIVNSSMGFNSFSGTEGIVISNPGEIVNSHPVNTTVASDFTMASTQMVANDALSIVNQKRRQRGLHDLAFDAALSAIARNKSSVRANRRMTGHDGSWMGGARAEGVGFSTGGAAQFTTCHLYSSGFRSAGAAISYDASGRAYFTLLLK